MDLKFLLNIDIIILIIIMFLALFFIITSEKKQYPFIGASKKISLKGKNKFGKSEEICRDIFQQIFKKRFVKIRPPWLKNPLTGKNLELDGFCADIRTPIGYGLGFERDGEQHSKFTSRFHKTQNDFLYQVKKDNLKDKLCLMKGIILIRIPYFITEKDMKSYIINELRKKKY